MNRIRNLAIVFLLTIVAGMAFASPASANGFISGTVLDNHANPIAGANVTATNGTDVFFFITNSLGTYVITIPSANTGKDYLVTATKLGFFGAGVQTLNVTDGNTTVAQNIVLVKATYPTTKTDTAGAVTIPADHGMTSTVITATIRDQDGNLLVGGFVNGTTPAQVNFYLRNGTGSNKLDVTTGLNGTLTNTGLGTQVDSRTVTGVPIDANGNATVTLNSGFFAGSVTVFNNVTVTNINGQEVNATIQVTFTPLIGYVTGNVRYSNNVPVPNATVTAQRYTVRQIYNLSNCSLVTAPFNDWEQVLNPAGGILSTISLSSGSSIGDYVLPIPVLFNDSQTAIVQSCDGFGHVTGARFKNQTGFPNTFEVRLYQMPPFVLENPTGELVNYVRITGTDVNGQSGTMQTSLMVRTATGNDVVIPQGEPDNIKVTVEDNFDLAQHNAGQPIPNNLAGTLNVPVRGQLLKNNNQFAQPGIMVTFTITSTSPNMALFSNGASTITVPTDITGLASTTLNILATSPTGMITVTGTASSSVQVFSDQDVKGVTTVAQLSGIVTNDNQVQLAGATVTLAKQMPNGTFVPAVDINGNLLGSRITPFVGPTTYTFSAVPSGIYRVNATLGSQSGFAIVELTVGTSTANVVIIGGQPTTITGTVTNASSGAGIPGASIFLDGNDTLQDTGAGGSYTLSNIQAGSHVVMAVATGYINGTANVVANEGQIVTANIVLTPSTNSHSLGYWQCGANLATRKAGVINAINDYFAHTISKADIISVINEFLSPTC